MNTSIQAFGVAALTAALGLAGCKNSDTAADVEPKTKETEKSAPPAEAPEASGALPGTIRVVGVDVSHLDDVAACQIRAAEKQAREASSVDRAQRLGKLGMVYLAYELYSPAEVVLRDAIALQPNNYAWPFFLAHVHRKQGAHADAIERFSGALEIMEQSSRAPAEHRAAALCWLGELHLDTGSPEDAEACFQRTLALSDRIGFAHYGLGRVAARRKDLDKAREHLSRAYELLPAASNVQLLLGTVFRQLGDQPRAQQLLSASSLNRNKAEVPDKLIEAVHELADSSRKHLNLANRLFVAGRYAAARDGFRRALAIDDRNPRAHCNLGSALKRLGDRQAAEEAFRKTLAIDESFLTARFNLAVICSSTGRDEEAAAHYQTLLATTPRHKNALFNLANALARLHRFAEARDNYARVIAGDPGNSMARLGEARMLVLLDQHGQAARRLERALAVAPENPAVQHDLARLLVASPVEAIRDGKRGLLLATNVYQQQKFVLHAETLAMAHSEVGQFQQAVEVAIVARQVARREGRPDLAARVNEKLKSFQRQQPWRRPWLLEDLIPRSRAAEYVAGQPAR